MASHEVIRKRTYLGKVYMATELLISQENNFAKVERLYIHCNYYQQMYSQVMFYGKMKFHVFLPSSIAKS